MRKNFLIALILVCLSGAAAFYASADSVQVYTGADPLKLGRAVNRKGVTEVSLDRFLSSDSLYTEDGGITTAVLIDATVKKALDELLDGQAFAIVEGSVLKRTGGEGKDIYSFTWDLYGFDIDFAFEKLNPEIISEIEAVYGSDAYLYGELKRSYYDNYAVTVYRAEDVFNRAEKRIDFIEAMISATVIGSRFQPLLGIHDGLGVLDNIGLAAAGRNIVNSGDYNEYRKFGFNEEEIYSFIHSVDIADGDFIENLYSSVGAITEKHAEDGRILLPEELFSLRRGDNTDFSLFYFDILKRAGYQVKFITIDPGRGPEGLYNTVFFREKDADIWGCIDGNMLEREKSEKWQRLPALVFTASVDYFEPDIEQVFNEGGIELPPPSEWNTSFY